jgi:hypothetical protein
MTQPRVGFGVSGGLGSLSADGLSELAGGKVKIVDRV